MTINYVNIPLYSDPDYEYIISLERVAYKIRFYYNERMQQWIIDLRYADNTPIVLGEALVPSYPLFYDYNLEDLSGLFWLEPIGKNMNETIQNPFELNQYYKLYYYYETEDE